METAKQNFRVQLWISILSVVLLAGKLIAYFFTHSLSILTDALESIVNVLAGVIGLYSLYIAAKPRDKEHPYGHGKAEFISAAVEGTLIVLAGVLIMYETVRSVLDDAQVHKLDTGLILVGITALLNYIAGTVCIRIGKKNQSLALQASGKHLQTDTYSTLAIILGLLLMLFTGLAWIDKALAAVMSIYIMYNGYQIVRASLAGIMDEADMALLQRFVDVLNANRQENWIDLHNLRVIKYGITLHIDCHLTVPWYLNIHEAHQEIDQLGAIIRQEFGDAIEL
ncbi:MAG: hypothetical protein RIR90_2065, partial [Bacteroidota bacterium]